MTGEWREFDVLDCVWGPRLHDVSPQVGTHHSWTVNLVCRDSSIHGLLVRRRDVSVLMLRNRSEILRAEAIVKELL